MCRIPEVRGARFGFILKFSHILCNAIANARMRRSDDHLRRSFFLQRYAPPRVEITATHVSHVSRVQTIFEIVVDFPDSKPQIQDIKVRYDAIHNFFKRVNLSNCVVMHGLRQ